MLRSAVLTRGRRWRALSISVLAVLFVVSLSACGGDGGGGEGADKSAETLNFSAASAADAGVYGLSEEEPGGEEYSGYGAVQDTTGAISMEVPTEWTDVNGNINPESPFQAGLFASPNLQGYFDGWDYPAGVVIISKTFGAEIAAAELPDVKLSETYAAVSPRGLLKQDCDPAVKSAVIRAGETNFFAQSLGDLLEFGEVNYYSNCGGNGAGFLDIAGLSKDRTSFMYMANQLVRSADEGATERMLQTLAIDFTKVPEPATEQEEDPELIVP